MKLNYLTDKELLKETVYWVNQEREATCQVLWHLKEVDERKLFTELKCSSLYDYCLRILKYSEGQASRRVSACRLLRELPEISHSIENGDLNLTQINLASAFFRDEQIKNPEEKKKVIELIKGKTTRETERIFSEMKNEHSPVRVSLSLLEETVEELKKLRALKAHSCPDMDSLLKCMSSEVKRIWDPMVVHRQRKVGEGSTRYVQVGVKAHVWERDQGKCSNCGTTWGLELDHILPFGVGGKTVPENLRLLCKACNMRKGIVYYGKEKLTFN